MSTDVAVVGLTYDGQDIQLANLSILATIRRGLNEPPSVRGIDVTVPAAAGRTARARVNDTLQIILDLRVMTDPSVTDADDAKASYRTNWNSVRLLFATNRDPAALVATREDGSIVSISARPLNTVATMEIPGWYWEGTVELEGLGDWAAVAS